MFIRAYLRASTSEQDANRAKSHLKDFVEARGHKVASYYIENISGTRSDRPELARLVADSHEGDVLLIEDVSRLSRLPYKQWLALRASIEAKGLHIVSADLPTSHRALEHSASSDSVTDAILSAINNMLLDMFATFARKDYEDRRQKQAMGIQKAQAEGKYKGRPLDQKLHDNIKKYLEKGCTYSEIQTLTNASRVTISKVKKSM